MNSHKSSTTSIFKLFGSTVKAFKNHHILLAPFTFFACFEAIALVILFLAPRAPLIRVFGPIIRTFWDERFLHYPLNFLLLPKLVSLARMFLAVAVGSLMTGLAVQLVTDIHHKKEPRMAVAVKPALNKYFSLFVIILLLTLLYYFPIKLVTAGLSKYFYFGHKKLLFFGPTFWMGPALICINFLLAILIQAAFIYAIPVVIIDKVSLIKSIGKSFVLFKRTLVRTLLMVGLPMLLYLPLLFLISNSVSLVDTTFPEIMLLVLLGSIAVNSLIIDPLITVASTLFYLENKK